jgi:hypothetical protein
MPDDVEPWPDEFVVKAIGDDTDPVILVSGELTRAVVNDLGHVSAQSSTSTRRLSPSTHVV